MLVRAYRAWAGLGRGFGGAWAKAVRMGYIASLEDVFAVFQTSASRYAARVRERNCSTRMRAPISMDSSLPQTVYRVY